jgi:hypothetical protein
MRIPEESRKCVCFLGIPSKDRNGNEVILFKGTAFLVSVPSLGGTAFYWFLVTAAHVARKLQGSKFFIRLNNKDGKTAVWVQGSETERWWYHPTDKSVDVAVMHFGLPLELNDDGKAIPLRMFCTQSNLATINRSIGIGDEVFITGLFVKHSGTARNIPIVRFGNIAMMPEERVATEEFGEMEAYLIEARSIGGISGSPVFALMDVNAGGGMIIGEWRIGLLGIIHGHWDLPKGTQDDFAEMDLDGSGKINAGIAVVTPAEKIAEVLDHPELKKMLSDHEASQRHSQSTTAD